MILKLTSKYILTFLALTFVMHELHEIVHTTVGRIICGCWGKRDFNFWSICESCTTEKSYSLLATFAGPVFTFAMIWIGAFLLSSKNSIQKKALGFSLVFANLPFGRILTASLGGGDEVYALNKLLDNHTLAWFLGLMFIILILIVPLYKCFKIIENKKKVLWFLMFFILPTVIDLFVILGPLNFLLKKGVLSNYWILGSPTLVTLWTILVTLVYLFTYKNIYRIYKQI
ncbi:MAG: hypothetical protein HWD85_04220 [Flavobacteriaceae bacterium]|nr:hypothetical protein [Flavobacteriaceae bacterium]